MKFRADITIRLVDRKTMNRDLGTGWTLAEALEQAILDLEIPGCEIEHLHLVQSNKRSTTR